MSGNQRDSQHDLILMKDQKQAKLKVEWKASEKASDKELTVLKQSYEEFWKVTNCRSRSMEYPDGVIVTSFISIESDGTFGATKTFPLHELEDNKTFGEVLAKLKPFARSIDREMLSAMITYAVELRKLGQFREIGTEELDSMLGGAFNQSNATSTHRQFENSVIEELSNYASVMNGGYDPKMSFGILLDTPELKRKFGDNTIGVTKYTLMELFVWGEEPPELRKDYKSNSYDMKLNKILQGWKNANLLVKKTEYYRLNEWIKNPCDGVEKERFYIIECPRVYEYIAKGEGVGRNE
ncbi:hypothetical protein SAMN03159341_11510 [Paenibacillus sp. 1_12]|uniref:hypothetical protein n=1 Tax=Paenibacillus sp. 1_12 TaxID=1566278 RepID=UPI0008EF1A47|nr:hypothetical protein [Paenibacillus sp. 1_12]SFM05205.1 hypothetical protein SAMN03159341_11510 [Paenibacillus sp. 1_12]